MTTYSTTTIWILILVIGSGTFALRVSLIALLGRIEQTPPALVRVLRFIRPAVLAALIAPAVVMLNGEPTFIDPLNPRLVAGLVATAVAWKSRNTLLTIGSGMGVLWILQAVVQSPTV
jgi:branched-subunit amino acid transport protein